MTIREALPADRGALLDIWLRSVRATHTFLTEDDIQSLLPLVRDAALPALELWVLCAESGAAVGFLGLDGAEVEALFIAPKWCRRGAGGCCSTTPAGSRGRCPSTSTSRTRRRCGSTRRVGSRRSAGPKSTRPGELVPGADSKNDDFQSRAEVSHCLCCSVPSNMCVVLNFSHWPP